MFKYLVLVAFWVMGASGQQCNLTFYPCESPLINPNCRISFRGNACGNGGPCQPRSSVYDIWAAYDTCYQEDCGLVWDWIGCADDCGLPPLIAPGILPQWEQIQILKLTRRNRPSSIPAGLILKVRYEQELINARPGAKCSYTRKYRKYRKTHGV